MFIFSCFFLAVLCLGQIYYTLDLVEASTIDIYCFRETIIIKIMSTPPFISHYHLHKTLNEAIFTDNYSLIHLYLLHAVTMLLLIDLNKFFVSF